TLLYGLLDEATVSPVRPENIRCPVMLVWGDATPSSPPAPPAHCSTPYPACTTRYCPASDTCPSWRTPPGWSNSSESSPRATDEGCSGTSPPIRRRRRPLREGSSWARSTAVRWTCATARTPEPARE